MDEIRLDFIKDLDVVGLTRLTPLYKIMCTLGAESLDWQTWLVVPLFKMGNRRVCANYMGFSLFSLPSKAVSGVLEKRVQSMVEPQIHKEQCGFCLGRGTLDQLFTLTRVLEGSWPV